MAVLLGGPPRPCGPPGPCQVDCASSGERRGPGPIRVEAVKFTDGLGGVFHAVGWLPCGRIIPLPFDEVLQAVVVQPAVENPFYFPFLLPVYNDRRGRRRLLPGERVVCGVFQQGHMEDRVYIHGLRQAQSDGVRAYRLNNLVGAQPAVIQILRGAASGYISCIEPYLIPRAEDRSWGASLVAVLGLDGLPRLRFCWASPSWFSARSWAGLAWASLPSGRWLGRPLPLSRTLAMFAPRRKIARLGRWPFAQSWPKLAGFHFC